MRGDAATRRVAPCDDKLSAPTAADPSQRGEDENASAATPRREPELGALSQHQQSEGFDRAVAALAKVIAARMPEAGVSDEIRSVATSVMRRAFASVPELESTGATAGRTGCSTNGNSPNSSSS